MRKNIILRIAMFLLINTILLKADSNGPGRLNDIIQDSIQQQSNTKNIGHPSKTVAVKPFYIYRDANSHDNHFKPSGYMGDCGDVTINEACTVNPHAGKTCIKIICETKGKGPNECPDNPPCRWAGLYWLQPAENWGRIPAWKDEGYNLSAYNRLTFWAKADKACVIEFRVAGLHEPYGDSQKTPKTLLAQLSAKWAKYTIDLKDCNLTNIIGGFCWMSHWDTNPTGAIFYLDDIRFEKD